VGLFFGFVVDLFFKAPFLLLYYISYCQKFEASSSILKNLLDKNKDFRKFHDDVMSHEDVLESLDSFLIRPIQRIPRYNLLLNELLKCTPEDHPDFIDLNKAKAKMEEISVAFNAAIQAKANVDRMQEVEKGLRGYNKVVYDIYIFFCPILLLYFSVIFYYYYYYHPSFFFSVFFPCPPIQLKC
jgi:hypothetical protein